MTKRIFSIIFILSFTISSFAQKNPNKLGLEIPKLIKRDSLIVKHLAYTLSYNEKHEQANWVAYELTEEETVKKAKRGNHFIPDPMVRTGSSNNEDYARSGYDRGHLAPAADMSFSDTTMKESFFFSNMSPQVSAFNRGIWKELEEQIREWAIEYKSLYIVTGPILHDGLPQIGPDHVSVPELYYKVILDYTAPDIKAIGFVIPNADSDKQLQNYAVSVDSVECLSKINFFYQLPDSIEKKIESSCCIKCWNWNNTKHQKAKMQE